MHPLGSNSPSCLPRHIQTLGHGIETYPHLGDGLKLPQNSQNRQPLTEPEGQKYVELTGCLGYPTLTRSSLQSQLTYLQCRVSSPFLGGMIGSERSESYAISNALVNMLLNFLDDDPKMLHLYCVICNFTWYIATWFEGYSMI